MEPLRPLRYFSSPAFLQTDLKTGVLRSRGGTRLIGISADFLRGFVSACEHETGPATPLILRRCGQFFGRRLGKRYEGELTRYLGQGVRDITMGEFDILIKDLWEGSGLGELTIDWTAGHRGFLAAQLAHSPMQDIGPRGHVADDMFCGVLEGFLNHFSADSLTCVQTGDERLGNKGGTTFILAGAELVPRIQALVQAATPHSQLVAQLRGE